jgi:hypothetical protein
MEYLARFWWVITVFLIISLWQSLNRTIFSDIDVRSPKNDIDEAEIGTYGDNESNKDFAHKRLVTKKLSLMAIVLVLLTAIFV